MSDLATAAPERTPGVVFRAMGALLLLRRQGACDFRARELQQELRMTGVAHHLTGSISSVPPVVRRAMRHILALGQGPRRR